MRSVKNFLIERINSFDHSEQRGAIKKHSQKHQSTENSDDIAAAAAVASPSSTISTEKKLIANPSLSLSIPASAPITTDGRGHTGKTPETPASVEFIESSSSATGCSPMTPSIDGTGSCSGSGSGNAPCHAMPFNFTPIEIGTDTVVPVAGVTMSISMPTSKPQKSRKISWPWFRQSSVSTHVTLSRQHTIDSPGSFQFFQHQSSNRKVGAPEATWIVADYIATPGSNELNVSKGQQVEVVEAPTTQEPDFCLVRLNPQNDDAAVHEGLVPVSILKPPPTAQKSSSTRKDNNETLQEQTNNRAKPDPLTSSTKRRGFSGRKWLPPPLRKRSQSKVDKPANEKSLNKKASEKSLRLPQKHTEHEQEELSSSTSASANINYCSSAQGGGAIAMTMTMAAQSNAVQPDLEAEDEAGLELPPPMKPIQEPHLMANGPPAFNKDLKENSAKLASIGKMDGNSAIDLSEIEQIVKEKTEQHEEKSKFLKPNFDGNNTNSAIAAETNGRNSGISGISGESELSFDGHTNDNNEDNNTETSDSDAALKKRACALAELISTEELYIQDLAEIVNGYIAETRNPNSDILMPEDLKGGKDRIAFGNIEAIYEWHRDYFLRALQRCEENPSELGPILKGYERKFNLYYAYCQNKLKSDHVVTEHNQYFDQIRQKLRHRLELSDLLIKPVQRITKYELLLKEITKQTERAGLVDEVPSIKESYAVMKVVCRTVNDMMIAWRLQKFEGNITAQGKLLLHGPLTCIEDIKSTDRNASSVLRKPRELQVFLYEQIIIFSDIVGKKTQFISPTFICRSQMQVNKMQLEELPNNRFLLKSTDPKRPDLRSMICYAATIDLNREWLDTIRKILQSQHDFLKAITSPIQYQKELTKDS